MAAGAQRRVAAAATVLAALVQLRHAPTSNQIAALSDLYEKQRETEFVFAMSTAVREHLGQGLWENFEYA